MYFRYLRDPVYITFIFSWTVLIIKVLHQTMIFLTVCSYHVTYAFQSESTLYSCLNVKELLARNTRDIWGLSDCNGTRTHNHLVRKRTFNHLGKLAKCTVQISTHNTAQSFKKVFVYKLSGCGFEYRCSHLSIVLYTNCIWYLSGHILEEIS